MKLKTLISKIIMDHPIASFPLPMFKGQYSIPSRLWILKWCVGLPEGSRGFFYSPPFFVEKPAFRDQVAAVSVAA